MDNQADLEAEGIQHRFSQLLTTMGQGKTQVGKLADGIDHFLKVTSSYWSGLFHCYQVKDLPRTNNDLEHLFGQLRHHQRRVTGRKAAPASLVLRGSVRLIAAVTTRIRTFAVKDACNSVTGALAGCPFPIAKTSTQAKKAAALSACSQ